MISPASRKQAQHNQLLTAAAAAVSCSAPSHLGGAPLPQERLRVAVGRIHAGEAQPQAHRASACWEGAACMRRWRGPERRPQRWVRR